MDWDALSVRASAAPRLEELAVEDRGVHQVSCQPAMEFRSRIADWVGDIRRVRERGATVIVVTGSVGRAERTVEILHDYDIDSRSPLRPLPLLPSSSRGEISRRDSSSRRPVFRSTRRLTSSRKSDAGPSSAETLPEHFSQTFAI